MVIVDRSLNRPGLDQLRDVIQEGQVEAVLILSPDRLSRKQAHQIILLEEFKKRCIQVLFTNQTFSDSPEDQLMLQIQGALSEYERAKILDRMRRGIKHSVANGQVIGSSAPYGYRFIRKSSSAPAHWEFNPEEGEIVRHIFDWYVNQRMTGTAIAKRLQKEGYPTRSIYNKWWATVVFAILKNETYTGTAYMFKTKATKPAKNPKLKKYRQRSNTGKIGRPREDWIGIPVTPIIDKKTWLDAQRLLKENSIKSSRNNSKNNYLLRGLILCGLCGSVTSGYVSNKNTYYSCGAKRHGNITTKPHDEPVTIKHTWLDEKVWSGLVELIDNPNNLKAQLEKRLEAKARKLSNPSNTKNEKTDNELIKLDAQENRFN